MFNNLLHHHIVVPVPNPVPGIPTYYVMVKKTTHYHKNEWQHNMDNNMVNECS
jgi:hypothetical protein